MFRIKILFMLITLAPLAAHAQGKVPESVNLAFKAGNAEALAAYFNDNVELVILDQEDVYSRKQAEQIMRKFFAEHRPVAFKVIFGSGKEVSRYAIGSLETQQGTFRVYLLIKDREGKPLIHLLRIDREDDEESL